MEINLFEEKKLNRRSKSLSNFKKIYSKELNDNNYAKIINKKKTTLNFEENTFFYFIKKGSIENVKIFIQKKKEEINNIQNNYTALHIACLYNQYQIILLLLNEGANVII